MTSFKNYYPEFSLYSCLFILFILVHHCTLSSTPKKKECRCFPNEECWPIAEEWNYLNKTIGGRLSIPKSPIDPCLDSVRRNNDPDSCIAALNDFGKDPFWVQTFSGGFQSTGNFADFVFEFCTIISGFIKEALELHLILCKIYVSILLLFIILCCFRSSRGLDCCAK